MNTPSLLKPKVATRLNQRVHIDTSWQPAGVTDQFLTNASIYHARYYKNDYWKYLVGRGLDLAGINRSLPHRILDIGSGSGNTVFATAELMPYSVIFANDISPQLLEILVGIQDHIPQLDGRIEAYCFDLHKDFFADNVFDLVIGGAILHHMLDPEAALKNVARWLRPGGKIILIEPLEVGAHMMAAIYLKLIEVTEQELGDEHRLVLFFKAMCQDYDARFGVPRVKSFTKNLDDKWLFHISYLRELARRIGLELELVAPTITDSDKIFSSAVRGNMDVAGLANITTPDSMWKMLELFDQGISLQLKEFFAPEGIISLIKR